MLPDEPKNKDLLNAYQGATNFSYKWLESKYFRHCGPHSLCHTLFSV